MALCMMGERTCHADVVAVEQDLGEFGGRASVVAVGRLRQCSPTIEVVGGRWYCSVTSSSTMSVGVVRLASPHNGNDSILTDEVIEPQQSAAELWEHGQYVHSSLPPWKCLPLSPFMMTHMREPMHRSMSSSGIS